MNMNCHRGISRSFVVGLLKKPLLKFRSSLFKGLQGQGKESLAAIRRWRNSLRQSSGARRIGVRNATAFRGESEQDRFPLVSFLQQLSLENVPVERFQRDIPNIIPGNVNGVSLQTEPQNHKLCGCCCLFGRHRQI